MSKNQGTFIEVNLNSLQHNFNFIKSIISERTKVLAVVKAYAYGTEPSKIASFLEKLKVDYFAVAYTSEAVKLRQAGIKKPILVFHPQPENLSTIIKHNLIPTLYCFKILELFKEILSTKKNKNYPVHLKINTGLNRIGFNSKEISELIDSINQDNFIKIDGVYSHLSSSEDKLEFDFTQKQISLFTKSVTKIIKNISDKPIVHLCNTSGIINFPEAHFDMVRCGIGLYGFSNKLTKNKSLIPVVSLKSSISQIHFINKGDSVGYNRGYITETNKKIGTIPLGHADGISRLYGNNNGFVFIKNKKAPIIGNVCMDMLMVDISKINCEEGDEVIIFNEKHSAEQLAESVGTISYELLTALSRRIERKFII
ncbi:alanine racemase [Flavobacteriaceae bacterium]|jgi:alanine racemase|nr:alanine racemase [Flavobacteriaceae bacterium]MDC0909997.1 alanine racemase [Flavobacteriaceae bacterium]MDC1179665.1 alanine racemase [Flavobacteriaceae bacterium]